MDPEAPEAREPLPLPMCACRSGEAGCACNPYPTLPLLANGRAGDPYARCLRTTASSCSFHGDHCEGGGAGAGGFRRSRLSSVPDRFIPFPRASVLRDRAPYPRLWLVLSRAGGEGDARRRRLLVGWSCARSGEGRNRLLLSPVARGSSSSSDSSETASLRVRSGSMDSPCCGAGEPAKKLFKALFHPLNKLAWDSERCRAGSFFAGRAYGFCGGRALFGAVLRTGPVGVRESWSDMVATKGAGGHWGRMRQEHNLHDAGRQAHKRTAKRTAAGNARCFRAT